MFYKDNENVTSIPFEEYNKQSNEAENKEQEIEIYFDNLDKNISRQQAQQDNAIVNSTEAENNELFHDTEIEDNDESLNDPNDTREEDMNIEATSNDPEERRTYNLRDRSQIDLPKNFEDYVMAVMDVDNETEPQTFKDAMNTCDAYKQLVAHFKKLDDANQKQSNNDDGNNKNCFSSHDNQTRPLLHDDRRREDGAFKPEKIPDSYLDSEQDDMEYVLMQMQKSQESLTKTQKRLSISGFSSVKIHRDM
ncbi:hypothetical protein K1T71_003359 [Dendrolimus kikuchii]|uniref:Uncharacterized protein n=1 Tax=Dendrolimus kikuchii TaxID=765133 RepID=A0ACC1DBG0_9NEOP|nr:hypothetical protein K1T71_003359 [Dendrolimus kikuchii]